MKQEQKIGRKRDKEWANQATNTNNVCGACAYLQT